jgi:hypothetical protein
VGGHILHHLHELRHGIRVAAGRRKTSGSLLLWGSRSSSRRRIMTQGSGDRLALLVAGLEGMAL